MNAIVLPILIPLIAAALAAIAHGQRHAQRLIAAVAAVAQILAAWDLIQAVRVDPVLVLRVGDWFGGYGIVFVVDMLSAMMLFFSALAFGCCQLYLMGGGATADEENGFLHPLFLALSVGVNWSLVTGDLFNLFVAFEIMLIASYALLSYGFGKGRAPEAVRFIVTNLFFSTVFLCLCGFAYGTFGTLNMAELAIKFAEPESRAMATAIGTLMLLVFGAKCAVYPLFVWLPDAYPRAALAVVPYFGGVLTKVGVYCLFRMFTLIVREDWLVWFQPLLLGIGCASMLIGVFGAMSQWTMRSILSFHIVSQIGYMVVALAMGSPLALAAGIFFLVHQIPVKGSLFMIAGSIERLRGSDSLKESHGLASTVPGFALLFFIAAMSLAGIPPTSGFYGKFGIVVAGFSGGFLFATGVALLTSVFTLYSMVKIWRYMFWGNADTVRIDTPDSRVPVAGPIAYVGLAVLLAVFAGPTMELAEAAAHSLIAREMYIDAVLGEGASALLAQQPLPVAGGRP